MHLDLEMSVRARLKKSARRKLTGDEEALVRFKTVSHSE
jgi:hypothetical protein